MMIAIGPVRTVGLKPLKSKFLAALNLKSFAIEFTSTKFSLSPYSSRITRSLKD